MVQFTTTILHTLFQTTYPIVFILVFSVVVASGRVTKITLIRLMEMYKRKEPITVLTAHDYPSARWCDQADVDVVLVGDSLGMVALGEESTTSVTMDVNLILQ